MNTKITITSNGNVSPNIVFDLGNKYESVGDTLEFIIPQEYQKPTNHYYLTFKMKKMETKILPVTNFIFEITRTITNNPGTYEIIFLATENAIVNGDIDAAKKVFISNTMKGTVKDNYLQDPITEEVTDPNIELYYNKLDALADQLQLNMDNNVYQGDYYKPHVDEFGYLTWSIMEGEASDIPTGQNITGPTGPYYKPVLDENGIINFEVMQSTPNSVPTEAKSVDVLKMVKEVSDRYLEDNLEGISSTYLDQHLEGAVTTAVDDAIKFEWDDVNQILYITAAKYDTISGE